MWHVKAVGGVNSQEQDGCSLCSSRQSCGSGRVMTCTGSNMSSVCCCQAHLCVVCWRLELPWSLRCCGHACVLHWLHSLVYLTYFVCCGPRYQTQAK